MQIESENERISDMVFSSFWGGFSEAKVVENHPKSLSEGARERKHEFSGNVGFTNVKPSFSRSEASQNECFWRENRFGCLSRRGVGKTLRKSAILGHFGSQNGAIFE